MSKLIPLNGEHAQGRVAIVDDDESEFGTCETCAGEFWPGGSSCDCHLNKCLDCGDIATDVCNCCRGDLCPMCYESGAGFCRVCPTLNDFSERMAEVYRLMNEVGVL